GHDGRQVQQGHMPRAQSGGVDSQEPPHGHLQKAWGQEPGRGGPGRGRNGLGTHDGPARTSAGGRTGTGCEFAKSDAQAAVNQHALLANSLISPLDEGATQKPPAARSGGFLFHSISYLIPGHGLRAPQLSSAKTSSISCRPSSTRIISGKSLTTL